MHECAVIFDLFGTLVDDFGSAAGAVHVQMAEVLNVPQEAFNRLWNETLEVRLVGALGSVEASIRHVLNAINASADGRAIERAVALRMRSIAAALEPRPGAVNVLAELRRRGFKVGLISNSTIEIPILWDATAFAPLIDSPVFSSLVGLKKPDPRIFQLACRRLAVPPPSCVYVADGEDYELAASAAIGLKPVLLRSPSNPPHARRREASEWRGAAIASLSELTAVPEIAG